MDRSKHGEDNYDSLPSDGFDENDDDDDEEYALPSPNRS
jgi:hypothetical protein